MAETIANIICSFYFELQTSADTRISKKEVDNTKFLYTSPFACHQHESTKAKDNGILQRRTHLNNSPTYLELRTIVQYDSHHANVGKESEQTRLEKDNFLTL